MSSFPFALLGDKAQYFTPEAVAEMVKVSDTMNRKTMRAFIDKTEKKYKKDIENVYTKMRKQVLDAQKEIREETSHYYQGMMYALFICSMKKAGLADRTVLKVLNPMAGTLNALNAGEITVIDLKKTVEEEYGMSVTFDINRNLIPKNIFEEDVKKNGKAEKKG